VAALQKAGLLETRKVHKIARDAKVDRRSLALRITPAGVQRIEPVYERYAELCVRLLSDVGADVRGTVLEVNEKLMEKARWGV
jgi:DNA-binding MarR family transcriptional regulator